jgi:hypothetical protein
MRNPLGQLLESPHKLLIIGFLMLLVLIPASFTLAQDLAPTSVPADGVEQTAGDIVDFTTQTAQVTANTLEDFVNRLIQTPKSDVARVLLIMGGVLLLVAGWRIYDFVTLVAGFLIGAMIALSLVVTDNTFITVAAILIGGLIGAALGYFLYYIAVFLIGAYIGVVVTGGLAFQFALGPVNPVVLLIGALIGGLVLIGLSFQFLILLSALVGAQMLSLGLGLAPIWTLILAAVGVIVQLALARAYNYDWRRRPRRMVLWRRSAV